MSCVRWPILGVTLLVSFSSSHAFAQATGDQVATAQALFDDGKRLMQEGHYDEACPKLVESQRLDPGGGTLLAIGLCHEAQGKPATAWGDFSTALSEARKDRRPDRESAALEHIRALEEKMPRVRIAIAARVDGLEIRRDGAVVGSAQWGTPLPLDPGVHRFEAHAPGRGAWAMDVTVPTEAKMVDVTIPELKVAPEAPPVVSVAIPAPVAAPPPREGNAVRTWGFVTGGFALAFVGVGAGLGVSASSKWNGAKSSCVADRCTDPSATQQGVSAGNAADVSTLFFTVGGVGVAASVVLLVLSATETEHPSAATRGLAVTPLVGAINGLSIRGAL